MSREDPDNNCFLKTLEKYTDEESRTSLRLLVTDLYKSGLMVGDTIKEIVPYLKK